MVFLRQRMTGSGTLAGRIADGPVCFVSYIYPEGLPPRSTTGPSLADSGSNANTIGRSDSVLLPALRLGGLFLLTSGVRLVPQYHP